LIHGEAFRLGLAAVGWVDIRLIKPPNALSDSYSG